MAALRRRLADAVPSAPVITRDILRIAFGLSLVVYLALKLVGVVAGLSPVVDLTLLPAGLCALALGRDDAAGGDEINAAFVRPALVAGVLLVAFTTTYVALNTVPISSSVDESAIVNGAHELMSRGSLRVTSSLNERYDTNIIGSLEVTYRTPTDMYHRAFPGAALSYAPFSALPGDSGYYFYTAFFGTAAIVALYLVAWKLLGSWPGALVAALMFAVSPAFGHWAVTVYNNVPALSFEFGALALVLWSTPPRGWQLSLAGVLMTLAVFLRITEAVFVVPMLVLVWWRCRSWRACLPFAATAFSCVPLVLLTNAIFFHSPFFFPHVGSGYLPLGASESDGSGQGLLERYFLFVIGVSGSASNFHPADKLDNLAFHIRYLGSSTFAFPFLALAFTGLAWGVALRRANAWLHAAAVGVAVTAVLLLYGHQHDNYYGYGLPIARSSFVRYALPIYGLLAIAAGAFFVEVTRVARLRGAVARLSLVAFVVIVGIIGVARSYDSHVYGFNRLNESRDQDRSAWQQMDAVMRDQKQAVLLIVGPNSVKLVDASSYPHTINYSVVPSWEELLYPVVSKAQRERHVYFVISTIQAESAQALAAFEQEFSMEPVLRSGNWALYEVGRSSGLGQ